MLSVIITLATLLAPLTPAPALVVANATCESWDAECYYDAGVPWTVAYDLVEARHGN